MLQYQSSSGAILAWRQAALSPPAPPAGTVKPRRGWVLLTGSYGRIWEQVSAGVGAPATVTPTRIASTVSFGTATVARTAVAAVSPTSIASTATFGSHAVAAAGMGAVSAARIASTVTFGAAVVARSAVRSVQPGRIDSSATFGVPVVTSSTPQIVVGRIASTAVVYAPAVVRTGPVVAASEYRRFASPFATLRQADSAMTQGARLGSRITQTVTLASAIDLE